jgi:hypothetical protein
MPRSRARLPGYAVARKPRRQRNVVSSEIVSSRGTYTRDFVVGPHLVPSRVFIPAGPHPVTKPSAAYVRGFPRGVDRRHVREGSRFAGVTIGKERVVGGRWVCWFPAELPAISDPRKVREVR